MKLLKTISLITLFVFALNSYTDAQCKTFARKECLPELTSFTHDGNYHAAVLIEGEEAELYKTFYSDMEYRVAIVGESSLPAVEFKIVDINKNVLYSNKDNNYASTWDFKLESSQQLKLVIKISSFNQPGDTPASGCVAIMFGFKLKR
jgi:hypothetical protein